MKIIRKITAFFNGIRFPGVILGLMMTGSVTLGMITLAQVNYLYADYNMIKDSPAEAYYLANLSAPPMGKPWSSLGEELVAGLLMLPGIEKAYTIKTAGPITYQNEGISVLLYPRELIEDFPILKKMGYDFEKDPDGAVLCSVLFDGFKGDTLTLSAIKDDTGWHNFKIKVNSVVSPMYKIITLGGGASSFLGSYMLLGDSGCIICADTEANESLLKEYTGNLTWTPNVIFRLKKEATEAEKEEVFRFAGEQGNYASLKDIAESDLKEIKETMRLKFPQPLFLLFTSLIAYLSVTVLIVAKKDKELAISYLCGDSRKGCIVTIALVLGLMSLIPSLICVGICFLFRGIQSLNSDFLFGCLFNTNCIWLILGFFVLTLTVALTTVLVSMRRKTPVELLRGAE